jgi:hypothetical protein
MERDGLGGFELVVVAFAGVVLVALIAVWSGATLSLVVSGEAGRIPFAAAAEAAPRLPRHFGDPAAVRPEPHDATAGRPIYWLSTALTLVVVLTTVVAGLWWLGRRRVGTSASAVGVDARPARSVVTRRIVAIGSGAGPFRHRDVRSSTGRDRGATSAVAEVQPTSNQTPGRPWRGCAGRPLALRQDHRRGRGDLGVGRSGGAVVGQG